MPVTIGVGKDEQSQIHRIYCADESLHPANAAKNAAAAGCRGRGLDVGAGALGSFVHLLVPLAAPGHSLLVFLNTNS